MPWVKIDVMDHKKQFIRDALTCVIPFKQLCTQHGISTVTGYKIKKRFLEEGYEGLQERSRRPKHAVNKLDEDSVCRIIKLRVAHPTWGPEKLRVLFVRSVPLHAPSMSTIKRVLAKAGLVRAYRARRRFATGSLPRLQTCPTRPNELWTVDFKGWWATQADRCEPLTVRDAFSRFVLCAKAMTTIRTDVVQACFVEIFKRYGLPDAIHTDNGSPFGSTRSVLGLTRLSAWWVSLGIQLSRSRPGHPQDNGAHERMHRDMEAELRPRIEHSSAATQMLLDEWVHQFNYLRPHHALQGRCPSELYRNSDKRFHGSPKAIVYPPHLLSRLVDSNGCIRIDNTLVFISTGLRGWNVGLLTKPGQTYQVWFDSLLMGTLDIFAAKLIWASPDELATFYTKTSA